MSRRWLQQPLSTSLLLVITSKRSHLSADAHFPGFMEGLYSALAWPHACTLPQRWEGAVGTISGQATFNWPRLWPQGLRVLPRTTWDQEGAKPPWKGGWADRDN